MNPISAVHIDIRGIVQGVGFRPFIYNLAREYHLSGWVRNTAGGVEIEIAGDSEAVQSFLDGIKTQAPPLSRIDSLQSARIQDLDAGDFVILPSEADAAGFQPISPDVSICQDCLEELYNPRDFRYGYPFINCTNCGPRFTIIQDIPYDRPKTTMAPFPFCEICEGEYHDPANRRFHAQPVACPACGPRIWLEDGEQKIGPDLALQEARKRLSQGQIGAIKGLGGFHLACDAANLQAVQTLRSRKNRPHKPLAVMFPNLELAAGCCLISRTEAGLLESPRRPILLLQRQAGCSLPEEIAPGQNTIGVMLPYTPLHYLLFRQDHDTRDAPCRALVMTSANFSGSPILTRNQDVSEQLPEIADFFLFHNREIHIPCDDSVARVFENPHLQEESIYPIRRARGYAPQPLSTPHSSPPLLASGAELKNTFCLTQERYAFLSQHIGDLKNLETLAVFEASIQHFQQLFRIEPQLLVHDLHPDYLSTSYARERSQREEIPTLAVQHHHAHIASCIADNGFSAEEPVIGVAFDGVGYGVDGKIWGGEFLAADYSTYQRVGQLAYFPLPGGDLAVREPWRIALGLLDALELPWERDLPPAIHAAGLPPAFQELDPLQVLEHQLKTGTNTPLTSSMGRLFDAVSALIGVCQQISYEGQAAIELEALADPDETGRYEIEISSGNTILPGALIAGLLHDLRSGQPIGIISARFHNTLADVVHEVCQNIRRQTGLSRVALSGGVWQNMSLLTKTAAVLKTADFEVLTHQQVPANDGGIAFGQALIGQNYLNY